MARQNRSLVTLIAKLDEAIALDSKAVRGATDGEQEAPHLLAFCTHESRKPSWRSGWTR